MLEKQSTRSTEFDTQLFRSFDQQGFAEAKAYKKQERFIARRFGVIVTPLSRD